MPTCTITVWIELKAVPITSLGIQLLSTNLSLVKNKKMKVYHLTQSLNFACTFTLIKSYVIGKVWALSS